MLSLSTDDNRTRAVTDKSCSFVTGSLHLIHILGRWPESHEKRPRVMDLPQKCCYLCVCTCSADVGSTPLLWGTTGLEQHMYYGTKLNGFEVEVCRKTAGSNFPFLSTRTKLLTSLPWFPFYKKGRYLGISDCIPKQKKVHDGGLLS